MKGLRWRREIFPFSLFFLVILLWVAWMAALLKVFNAIAILGLALALALLLWRLIRPRAGFYFETQDLRDRIFLVVVLLLIAVFIFVNFYFFHDSFGFRDESLYASNSIYLVQHGNLPYPMLNGVDSRLFLNTVWDAELYGLFGLAGLRLSNVILAALALLCIYFLVKELAGSSWPALFALLLIGLSYPFAWFMRRTNNEIFFFSLTWISFYLLYRCMKPRPSFKADLTLLMLVAPLPAFVRPEGLIILGVSILGAIYVIINKRGTWSRVYPRALFALLVLIMILSGFLGYQHMAKKYGGIETLGSGGGGGVASTVVTSGNELYKHYGLYSYWAMLKFGIMPALLLIPPFFIMLFLDRKKRLFAVFLLLATLPFFYFFYHPSIHFDMPWFLRRFLVVVIPLAFVAFSVVIFKLKKPYALAIAAVYLALTIFIASPVLFFHDRAGAMEYTARIAEQLPDGAKVLVDQYVMGDYSLIVLLNAEFGVDAGNLTPWTRLKSADVGNAREVYIVTNVGDFRTFYDFGKRIFDDKVKVNGVTIETEMDIEYSYLQPTAELARGAYVDSWNFMDYRVALSYVKVPKGKVVVSDRLMIVKLEIEPRE